MRKDQKSPLIFAEPRYLAAVPPSRVEFLEPEGIINVESNPGDVRNYGLIAGSEGLGCEFFLDADNTLFAMDLSLPFAVIDVPPMQLLEPVKRHLKDKARPGALTLRNCPKVAINPDAVWFFTPFGSAIWSFDWVVLAPVQRFLEESQAMEFVEIGRGLTAGIVRETGLLRLLMVQGFDKNQRLFGVEVSAESSDEACMQALNSMHLKYFEDPEPAEFSNFANAMMARLRAQERNKIHNLENVMAALDQLGETYRRNLELAAEETETE